MESNRLDDSIKKALENFRADGSDHWEQMENLLNNPANADLSELAEDQILRNKLGDIQPEAPVGHWALMEAQLAGMNADGQEELEDVMLDGKAYESLNNFRQPYDEQHWPIMEEKIAQAFSWRKRAVRFKVTELAILLLTFVTIFQYWPEAKEILPRIKKNLPKLTAPKAQAQQLDNPAIAQLPAATAAQTTITDNTNLEESETTGISNEVVRSNVTSEYATTQLNTKSVLAETHSFETLNQGVLAELATNNNLIAIEKENQLMHKAIPLLEYKPVEQLKTKPLSRFSTAFKAIKFSKAGFRIGMYGLSSYDAVDNNPEQIDLLKTSASTIGYGTGLSLAFKTGRWELESGIGYFSKTVKPSDPTIEVDQISLNLREFAGTSWTETQYDIINIPVHVRFDMMHRPKWKMYIQSGLSMSINQNVIYRYDQVYGGSGNLAALAPAPGIEQDDRAKAFDPPTAVAKNVGAAEEDLFGSNAYINMEFGFGLERAINRRYAAFLQTQYVHQFGPYSEFQLDEKNSIFRSPQLRAGIKATLFK